MPYVNQEFRKRMASSVHFMAVEIDNPGELNYVVSALLAEVLGSYGELDYQTLSKWRAALTDASDEFYRRVMAPYEDQKMCVNGDVYDGLLEKMAKAAYEAHSANCDCSWGDRCE